LPMKWCNALRLLHPTDCALHELFVSRPFRCYPVVNESRLVGQLSRRNILRALEKLW
jgi:predicted transcriptional regulator